MMHGTGALRQAMCTVVTLSTLRPPPGFSTHLQCSKLSSRSSALSGRHWSAGMRRSTLSTHEQTQLVFLAACCSAHGASSSAFGPLSYAAAPSVRHLDWLGQDPIMASRLRLWCA